MCFALFLRYLSQQNILIYYPLYSSFLLLPVLFLGNLFFLSKQFIKYSHFYISSSY